MRPLADLHRHLDGSLRPSTVAELAARAGVSVPRDLKFHAGMGLRQALSRFAFTLSLLKTPDAVRRIASEICEDAQAEGVSTLEIRFAPQLHTGAPLEAIVDAAAEGIAGRAGLIVCGLYHEPVDVMQRLVDVAKTRRAVTGVDLAGGPVPSGPRLEDFAPAFTRAHELGLGITVHAAEGRPPEEIRIAVEKLHARRIGHGTTLLEDARVTDLVIERAVTLEACPTSNVHTGVIGSTNEHPLPRWLQRGARACICTDNTLLSDVDAKAEHARAAAMPGMTPALLDAAIGFGHAAAFQRG